MVLKSRLNRVQLAVLLLPGLFIFGMFTVYPIFRLLWMSFIGFGIAIIALYALVYPMDRKRFPKLYCA